MVDINLLSLAGDLQGTCEQVLKGSWLELKPSTTRTMREVAARKIGAADRFEKGLGAAGT
jgi:hypothetical protein